MEVFIWIALIIGLLGSFLPVLPGPLISAVGLAIAAATQPGGHTSIWAWAAVGAVIFVLDYFLPAILAKKSGASNRAANGATIGMILSLFTGPGIFLGAFIGAFIGEYSLTQDSSRSLKAAGFALVGAVTGIFMKVLYCTGMIVLYIYHFLFLA